MLPVTHCEYAVHWTALMFAHGDRKMHQIICPLGDTRLDTLSSACIHLFTMKSIVTEFSMQRFDVWYWADLAFTKTHTAGAGLGFVHPLFIMPVSRWPTSFSILAREPSFAKTVHSVHHAGNLVPPTQVSIWRWHRQRRNYPVTPVSRRTSFSHSATKLRAAGGPVALRLLSYHRCW